MSTERANQSCFDNLCSCDSFILSCNIYGVTFANAIFNAHMGQNFPRCCGTIVDDANPIFTPSGMCYTTKAAIDGVLDNSAANIKFLMETGQQHLPSIFHSDCFVAVVSETC